MRKAGMWKRKISIAKETTPPKHDMVTVWGKRLLKNSVRRKKKLETDKKNLRESVKGNASILPAHINYLTCQPWMMFLWCLAPGFS